MHLANPAELQTAANADREFRLAARYWSTTLDLVSSSGAVRLEIANGHVAGCRRRQSEPPAAITITGADDGWAEFLAPVPRPFYQDLLGGCVQHHGFTVGGDILGFHAYYPASQRLFAIMRMLHAAPTEGR